MTYEAELRDRKDDPVDFYCADGTGIAKGTLLKLSDARVVSAADSEGCVCAGIAAREKVANDGRTRIAVYQQGIFDMVASGAISVGSKLIAAGVNNQVKAGNAQSGAAIIGYALETATDGERIQVRLML